MQSMTGFASKELEIRGLGRLNIELKSSNHKYLETICRLPEELFFLEDKIKKEVELKIKRGRISCSLAIVAARPPSIFINEALLKSYISAIRRIKAHLRINDNISLDALLNFPGVLSSKENTIVTEKIWPKLKSLIDTASLELRRAREREGRALTVVLKRKAQALKGHLGTINTRFKIAIREKLTKIATEEERVSFLKSADITEEIERLAFHIKNFTNKLFSNGPIGKELDFIAQEMQREANTLAAKSCDIRISAKVIQVKSLIEQIREQAQNVA